MYLYFTIHYLNHDTDPTLCRLTSSPQATSRKAHVLTELKRFDDAEALLSGLLSALPITQKPSPSVTPTATCFATAPSGNLLAFSDLTVSMTTAQQAEVERQRADCRLQAEEARMEATHRNYMAWKAGAIGGDEVDGTIATGESFSFYS